MWNIFLLKIFHIVHRTAVANRFLFIGVVAAPGSEFHLGEVTTVSVNIKMLLHTVLNPGSHSPSP